MPTWWPPLSVSGPRVVKLLLLDGRATVVSCDLRCEKAWGHDLRQPGARDVDLAEAPADLRARFDGREVFKPITPDQHLNDWCVYQCERSRKAEILPGGEP